LFRTGEYIGSRYFTAMKLSHQILLGFSIVIILSLVDSYTNYLLSLKVRQNADFISRSETIIRNSSQLHKSIIEMQSAFRGYLLTHDSTFLQLYEKGIVQVPTLMAVQRSLVTDSAQVNLLNNINRLHHQWLNYSTALINAKKDALGNRTSEAKYNNLFETRLRKQVGKKLNDEITEKFNEFDRFEYNNRQTRGKLLISSIEQTHKFSFLFLSLTIIVGLTSTIYIFRLISTRIASMVKVAEKISKGDFSIVKDTRNDELTGLSTSLNVMSAKLSKNISELEKRNSELNQFAYVVSHDLKAPLRGIYNVVHWIEEDLGNELSPQLAKYLNIIPQRTKRMEDLINGLLDFARLRERTTAEVVDTYQIVKDIAELLIPRDFTVEIGPLPDLYAERIKVEQVFINIISNAVKYTNRPDGVIRVSSRELGEFYEFTISDNGMGIDPEYHEKIFEIFQTLREKNEKESTGIGLAITKKIIDDQHGTIRVESEPEKGASFIFTWPKILPI